VLAFHNESKYRNVNMLVNSADDPSTACENLMNFGPVMPEITLLICANVYLYLAKIGLPHLHSSHCHSEMDWRIAMPMDALTSDVVRLHLLEIW